MDHFKANASMAQFTLRHGKYCAFTYRTSVVRLRLAFVCINSSILLYYNDYILL